MKVETIADVCNWLRAWGNGIRPGVLAAAISGQRGRLSIMRSNPNKYSPEMIAEAELVLWAMLDHAEGCETGERPIFGA